MKLLRPLLVLPLAAALAQAPATGRPEAAFVPPGYYVLDEGRATGDLNGDGRPDLALVLGAAIEKTAAPDPYPPRRLRVLLATPGGGYRLAAENRRAVLGKNEGGMMGDPFQGIGIQKGVLALDHYGGSARRWGTTEKFRWQQNDFYLIGHTRMQHWSVGENCPGPHGFRAGDERLDENLLTGAFERYRVSDVCRVLENRRGRHPVRPLVRLSAYAP